MPKKAYWTIVGLAAAAAIAAIFMGRWGSPAYHGYARILGWAAIAVLVIARFFLRPKDTAQSATPRR